MKRFIGNSLYFVIPFVVYSLIIAFIDPFNYLDGFSITSEEKRETIAKDIEPHLYKIIAFENDPKKNWVLGDSRSNGLYDAMDQDQWASLSYGGASLKEMIQSFWWATEIVKPDTVLIGINLNLYNKFNRRFWVEETLSRKGNYFTYAFNKYTFNATVALTKSLITPEKEPEPETEVDDPEAKKYYWQKKLKETDKFYKNITYPDQYKKQLTEIAEYCKKEDIKLIFWIPPLHKDYHDVLEQYDLKEYTERFRSDMRAFGDVFDFNYDSKLIIDSQNFRDPVHFNAEIAREIEKEIRNYAPSHSKLYRH